MKTMNLEWKTYNVNLQTVQAAITALCSDCCGLSANSQLQVHINNDAVTDAVIASIQSYWDGLTNASPEATNYQSSEQIQAAAAAAKAAAIASATTKLETLGLSAQEIAAILGQ